MLCPTNEPYLHQVDCRAGGWWLVLLEDGVVLSLGYPRCVSSVESIIVERMVLIAPASLLRNHGKKGEVAVAHLQDPGMLFNYVRT